VSVLGARVGIHDGSSRPLLIPFVPSRSFACSRACSKTCDVLFLKVSIHTETRVTTSFDRSPISCKGLGQLIFESFQIFQGRVMSCFKSILFFSQRHATICFPSFPKPCDDLCLICSNLSAIQILKTGFFHADPHPGNLAVARDQSLIFYDFGKCRFAPSSCAFAVR
jgi:hypothetical protein